MEDKVELEIMINHNCGMNDEDGVQKKLKVSFWESLIQME